MQREALEGPKNADRIGSKPHGRAQNPDVPIRFRRAAPEKRTGKMSDDEYEFEYSDEEVADEVRAAARAGHGKRDSSERGRTCGGGSLGSIAPAEHENGYTHPSIPGGVCGRRALGRTHPPTEPGSALVLRARLH